MGGISIGGADVQSESLRLEYEQTVQTLRNWDTLFFNALSSLIIGTAVGGGIALDREIPLRNLKLLGSVFVIALFTLSLLYFIYNVAIVRIKVEVLRALEARLGMEGAYGRPRRMAWLTLILFTCSSLGVVLIALRMLWK